MLKIQFTLFGTQLNWSCARVLLLLATSYWALRLSHDARNLLAVLFCFMAFFSRNDVVFASAGLGNF